MSQCDGQHSGDPCGEGCWLLVEDDGATEGPIVLPEGASCATCAYSRQVQVGQSIQRTRLCVRMPPVPVLLPAKGAAGNVVMNITSQHPVVDDRAVCFEYDRAEVGLLTTGLG